MPQRPAAHPAAAWVYLKALFKRFITADASNCGSALTAKAGSTGSIVNRSPRVLGVQRARQRRSSSRNGRDPEALAALMLAVNADDGQRAVHEIAQIRSGSGPGPRRCCR